MELNCRTNIEKSPSFSLLKIQMFRQIQIKRLTKIGHKLMISISLTRFLLEKG